MSSFDPLTVRWFAREDDLIGGWCAMTVDKPPSEADYDQGEEEVADCMTEAVARHIVALHNATLEPPP